MVGSRQSGSVVVYVLVFFALVALCVATLVAATSRVAPPAALATAVVAGLIGTLGLFYEGRRDLDAALTFVSVFLLGITIFAVIYVFSVPGGSRLATTVAAASGVVALACGGGTYLRQHAPESLEYPDVLRRVIDKSGVLETDGIQFAGFVRPGLGASPHLTVLLLQNCFDAPRRVRVRFDADSHAKHLRYHREVVVDLGGAEVVRLDSPAVTPTRDGPYKLYFALSVSGTGGGRVRRRRARAASTRIRPGLTLALLFFGVLTVGGGTKFTLPPSSADLSGTALPPPKTEVIWKPAVELRPIEPGKGIV